jgi:hypothetical protein
MGPFFLAVGFLIIFGLVLMFFNYIERPFDNDSGYTGGLNVQQSAEHHPQWPVEMERLNHKLRRWWEW